MTEYLTFHSDPGHGWLEVPRNLFDMVKVRASRYSYKRFGTVFLEEDCDAPAFIKAYAALYGREPEIREVSTNADSFIRGLQRFES